MSAEQIDSIVAQYLNTQLREIEERLAMDDWKPNGPDWNETATDLLAERAETLEEGLAANNLKSTLDDARRLHRLTSPVSHSSAVATVAIAGKMSLMSMS